MFTSEHPLALRNHCRGDSYSRRQVRNCDNEGNSNGFTGDLASDMGLQFETAGLLLNAGQGNPENRVRDSVCRRADIRILFHGWCTSCGAANEH
jgi:hypothetical protein